ncbi:MAG: hypothetical protein OXI91_05255 [Chloroflexota bacterium]|nr:hypothetical protein [Chloroflexota bacterium]
MLEWGDNPEVRCQVANESSGVMFDDYYYSLTGLATKPKKWKHVPPAARYWPYHGEPPLQRPDRLEQEVSGMG